MAVLETLLAVVVGAAIPVVDRANGDRRRAALAALEQLGALDEHRWKTPSGTQLRETARSCRIALLSAGLPADDVERHVKIAAAHWHASRTAAELGSYPPGEDPEDFAIGDDDLGAFFARSQALIEQQLQGALSFAGAIRSLRGQRQRNLDRRRLREDVGLAAERLHIGWRP